jgi:hypothetical protein
MVSCQVFVDGVTDSVRAKQCEEAQSNACRGHTTCALYFTHLAPSQLTGRRCTIINRTEPNRQADRTEFNVHHHADFKKSFSPKDAVDGNFVLMIGQQDRTDGPPNPASCLCSRLRLSQLGALHTCAT